MAFLLILLGTVLFGYAGIGFGLVWLGRKAVRAGRRLAGEASRRRELKGEQQAPARKAQDVHVEPIPQPVDETSSHKPKGKRPKAPEGAEPAPQPQATPAPEAEPARTHHEYVRLDVDAGATPEAISDVMRKYLDDEVLGRRARAVMDTLESAEHRRASLFAELDGTFQRGTISWDKFSGPAYAALDAILRNSALLANRIQAFDSAAYVRLREAIAGEGNDTERRSETRHRRWRLFREMLESLDNLQETNEGLLLELEKLAQELSTISGPDAAGSGDQIIEEIRRLVDEAKYYRQLGQ